MGISLGLALARAVHRAFPTTRLIHELSGADTNGEREGTVRYEDCREKIWHAERPLKDVFDIYTCTRERNSASKIIGGTCVRIEYASSTADCKVAHIYNRKS